jgi:tryptophanyl-tRNA synthetase
VLKRPEPRLNRAMVVPGIDGQKMSKSYGNTIPLFEAPKATRKVIMSIKTDSKTVQEPKNPDSCTVFALYSLLADPEEVEELDRRYRAGGMGYGEAKTMLADRAERVLGPAREKRERLVKDPDFVEDVLRGGAGKARSLAREVMADVREACGLLVAKETHA